MKKGESRKTWRIRAELNGTRPPVWRRLLVSDRITLLSLHDAIQEAFGWQDYHLHEFIIGGVRYGDPENDEYGDFDIHDEVLTRLWKLGLEEGDRFTYSYDFGDNWQHTLWVEQILPMEAGARLPVCLGGGRARPPEDVGGVGGYAEFLEALADPAHPEHSNYLEWVGGAFDPEAFDLQAANERLGRAARRKQSSFWEKPAEGEETSAAAAFDPSRWASLAAAERELAARNLPLRRDVETFLTYIRDNKVTGTQSTGNLPRKAVIEVSAGFVHPPALETKIGEKVYPFRSEEEVWPVHFVHVLANEADLVIGEPGRRWRVTVQAEPFLSAPAIAQVFVLLSTWWHRINWLFAVPFNIFGEQLPAGFNGTVLSMLKKMPSGQPVEFEPFVDRLIEAVGWTWTGKEPRDIRSLIRSAVEHMVVDPLAEFGVLSLEHVKDQDSRIDWPKLSSFSLTGFGRKLIDALAAEDRTMR